MTQPKVLLLDCETSPLTVYSWGLREQDISLDQIIDTSYTLCWAAKWLGDKEIMFERTWEKKTSSRAMILRIHELLSEADTVVTYNGDRFDLPVLNKEFILHDLPQPAPFHSIDLIKTARAKFRFASNKLDHLAAELGLTKKVKHSGFMMWVKCMSLDTEAWEEMTGYNKQDVVVLEALYNKLLPWVKTHTNRSLLSEDNAVCPVCGSHNYQRRGYAYTRAGKYPRFQCTQCYSWFRGSKSEVGKGEKHIIV